MTSITLNLDEDETKVLTKRAKKNLMTIKEQARDIIRRSCASYKRNSKKTKDKIDDKLVGIFSRQRRGRPRKK